MNLTMSVNYGKGDATPATSMHLLVDRKYLIAALESGV